MGCIIELILLPFRFIAGALAALFSLINVGCCLFSVAAMAAVVGIIASLF